MAEFKPFSRCRGALAEVGRPVGLLMLAACWLGLPGLDGASGAQTPDPVEDDLFQSKHELVLVEGLDAEITKDGLLRQRIHAETAWLDEKEQILDLKALRVSFHDGDEPKGEAKSGRGRIWLTDRPEENIAAHDLLLTDTVRYYTPEGGIVQSPEMRFTNTDAVMRSDKGYVKQLTLESQQELNEFFSGDFFEYVKADQFQYTPRGDVMMAGSVGWESPKLSVLCDRLTANPVEKTIIAEGSPLTMRQGESVIVLCDRFHYDSAARTTLLQGDAVIYQTSGANTTKMSADTIRIVEGEDGENTVTLEGRKRASGESIGQPPAFPRLNRRPTYSKLIESDPSAPEPASDQNFILGRGDRFEIKLLIEDQSFDSWTEYNAFLRKINQPELLP